ncbi:GSCOCG00001318001-RA-CDS [Cotesia congregata]|nr:GSCOCG00001318001-RA-CDS [Cotesia congregata]
MIFIVNNKSICMRFYTSEPDVPLNSLQEPIAVGKIFCRRQIYEFIFDSCTDCRNMAAVPQGAFAVCKVQEFMERRALMQKPDNIEEENLGGFFKNNLSEKQELTPLKYNSKLMNSIWGLYNRYSVHNLKKNTDPEGLLAKTLGNVLFSSTSSSASAKIPETSAEAHIL